MVKNRIIMPIFLSGVAIMFVMCTVGAGHEGKADGSTETRGKSDQNRVKLSEEKLKQINREYVKRVKPIFEGKCFSCHGSNTSYPWYYSVPGVKQLIDSDVRKAKEHMDMSDDFPFSGHGTPKEDLQELKKVIKGNSMPPLRYRVMHWDSALTDDDRRAIGKWAEEGIETPRK